MARKYSNFTATTFDGAVTAAATSITVTSAADFPTISSPDVFRLVLTDGTNPKEIVEVTSVSGNVLTVIRAQESTLGFAWQDGDAVELRHTANGFERLAERDVHDNILVTGVTQGGEVTINGGDNSKVDIAAGRGIVADFFTDPTAPVLTDVAWTAQIAVTITSLATEELTFFAFNSAGSLVQFSPDEPTQTEQRDVIMVGAATHADMATVSNTSTISNRWVGGLALLRDFADAVGDVNLNGNIFIANGANLTLNKSAGEIHSTNANIGTSLKIANTSTVAATVARTFFKVHQDGSGGQTLLPLAADIDPDFFDDLSGTLVAVGANKFTTQRIYVSPRTLNHLVEYGQTVYNSLSDARTAIGTEAHVLSTSGAATTFRSWLIVKKGATDLSDPTEAEFLEAPRIGSGGGGGSGTAGASAATLQSAYDASADPEIVLDDTKSGPAVSITDSSTPVSGNLLEIENNARSVTFFGVDATTASFGVDVDFSTNFLDIGEISTPANPAANVGRLYVKDVATVTTLFFRDNAGTETDLLAGGGGGATIELDNLGTTAINANLLVDTDSTYDLGATATRWKELFIDDITAGGNIDFSIASSMSIPSGAAPVVDADGELALDTTITDYTGMLKYFSTEEMVVLSVPIANLRTSDKFVVSYSASNNELDMVDVDTIVSTASTTTAGIAELATTAETSTGTDTGRVIPVSALPSQIQDSKYTYAADAEASDTYVITLTPAPAGYVTGQVFHFNANTVNTGAATLNVNGLGATTIVKNHDLALADGDIEAGQVVTVIYDGTNFQMQSQLGNAASGTPDQNLWETITSDSGSAVANITTDTLTIAGGTAVSTAVSGDTLTINADTASTTVSGVSELATVAETSAGTDTGRTIPVSALPLQIQDSRYVYAADLGSTDAYAITLVPAISAYAIGQVFHFKANTANTGGASLNVNGIDNKSILKNSDVALDTNDIEVGQIVTVVYDGASFQMQSQLANAADADQNLWETISGDTGSTAANITTDTLTIAGGTEITTAMSGDTLTINADFTPSSSDTLTNKTFDANGTGNSLSNVDVADLSNGVDGELITWDASAVPTTVAAGSAGDFLKSQGSGTVPIFAPVLGRFVSVQTFTADGTWTRPAGVTSVQVYVVGGGGGGGASRVTGASTAAAGSGGGGGGVAIEYIAAPGATETITIGAAGTTASDANGGAGGTSSFGAFCSATGGAGGGRMTASSVTDFQSGFAGGLGAGGDINIAGSPGLGGKVASGTIATAGAGGSNMFGGGGRGPRTTTSSNGIAGRGRGAGGGGGLAGNSQSATTGGPATAGVIYVLEYS